MKLSVLAAVTLGLMSTAAWANHTPGHNTTSENQATVAQGTQAAQTSGAFTTEQDKLSYTIGVDLGTNFKKQNIDLTISAFVKGMQDAQQGNALQLTKAQMEETLKKFQQKMMEKRVTKMKADAEKNLKAGEAFLAQNKQKQGVVALPSGLQYKVITPGTGTKPTKNDTVTVEYTGKLINGTVFDSTEKSGKPVSFKVTEVIPGWTEALQLMKTGATWEVYVPSKLAYGPRGVGGPIGPNQTLIFQIRLLSVNKQQG